MARSQNLERLLRRQAKALGRRIGRRETFCQEIHRLVGGGPYSEIVRRLSPPHRFRTDLSVDGEWRFSEAYDGARGWVRSRDDPGPTEAVRALADYRWSGIRLDHLQPLEVLRNLGCMLSDAGMQPTTRGDRLQAVQIALGEFAETVLLDEAGRVAGHRLDLPEVDEEEQELEILVDDWGDHEGLVHPARSTVLDRKTGEAFAEVVVIGARFEPYSLEVFRLDAD